MIVCIFGHVQWIRALNDGLARGGLEPRDQPGDRGGAVADTPAAAAARSSASHHVRTSTPAARPSARTHAPVPRGMAHAAGAGGSGQRA
jgi:hypothetical protein